MIELYYIVEEKLLGYKVSIDRSIKSTKVLLGAASFALVKPARVSRRLKYSVRTRRSGRTRIAINGYRIGGSKREKGYHLSILQYNGYTSISHDGPANYEGMLALTQCLSLYVCVYMCFWMHERTNECVLNMKGRTAFLA